MNFQIVYPFVLQIVMKNKKLAETLLFLFEQLINTQRPSKMHSKKSFSIIELLTVIFIIMALMTLIFPVFTKLKMNARTSICKNQLRQVGVLTTSYQTDHGGYLPFLRMNDIPAPQVGNNQLYQFWNGHLLPYLNVPLKENYNRNAMVTKAGVTRYLQSQLGKAPNPPPADVFTSGWVVIDDAFRKGGYQDLKTFICPEIHQNTFDVAASIRYNGVRVPRITQISSNGGVTSNGSFGGDNDHGWSGGLPTTYLANDIFYGYRSKVNSYRVDQINDISQKALVLEGGVADPFGVGSNGEISNPYYSSTYTGGTGYIDGGDLTIDNLTRPQFHKLSYVHDTIDKFWIMPVGMWYWYWPQYGMNFNIQLEIANKFNLQFAGKASMIASQHTTSGFPGYYIVSYIDPDNGKIFKDFFDKNPVNANMNSFVPYTDDTNDYHYLTGNMNVLFGDGSVVTKDQAWLCYNRKIISLPNNNN